MEMVSRRKKFMTQLNTQFANDFSKFTGMIKRGENFAFARYADGERLILNCQRIGAGTQAFDVDKWSFNNNFEFSKHLLSTCSHREENYYYAISCKCCDPAGELFYRGLLDNHNITFSNLFINANYSKFIEFVSSMDNEVVVIANKNCFRAHYPFKVIELMAIENDCINWYEKQKQQIDDSLFRLSQLSGKVFFISAGPLSEIIIHRLYSSNPNNTYIDVGSSLDIFTHNVVTRPYQNLSSEYNKKECVF